MRLDPEAAVGAREITFERASAAFDQALLARPEVATVSHFRFAGRLAQLRIVGDGLGGDIERPFAHLRVQGEAERPQLRIDLWEETATGVTCQRPENSFQANGAADITVSPDGRFVVYRTANITTALDRARQHLVGSVRASGHLTVYERARPLTAPLLLWLMDQGVLGLHAGLVAHDGCGILLGGPSGAGKTTAALACAQAGFDYLADDHVGLEPTPEGGFLGHSLFCSANLEPDHLRRFPALAPWSVAGRLPTDDKSLVLLSDSSWRLTASVAIRGIVLPRVTPGRVTHCRPASRPEALLRMAPSSLFLPHARGVRSTFQGLAQLIAQVPAYWLELGDDLTNVAPRVSEILARGESE